MNESKTNGPNDGRDDATRSQQGLRQSADPASGFVADDKANYSSVGAGQNQQHEASSGRYTNFNSASPESNVGPAGAPQTSHGNAGGPVPGSTVEKAEAGQNSQRMINPAAGGGNPSSAASADAGMANRAGSDDEPDKLSERLARGADNSGTPDDGPR